MGRTYRSRRYNYRFLDDNMSLTLMVLCLFEGGTIQGYVITFSMPPRMPVSVSGDSRTYIADLLEPESAFE